MDNNHTCTVCNAYTFLLEFIKTDPEGFNENGILEANVIYHSYVRWCKANRYLACTTQLFGRTIGACIVKRRMRHGFVYVASDKDAERVLNEKLKHESLHRIKPATLPRVRSQLRVETVKEVRIQFDDSITRFQEFIGHKYANFQVQTEQDEKTNEFLSLMTMLLTEFVDQDAVNRNPNATVVTGPLVR